MNDNREIGMRVGAAANQAAQVVPYVGANTVEEAILNHDRLTREFLRNMQTIQAEIEGGSQPAAAPAPAARPEPSFTPEQAENVVKAEFGATEVAEPPQASPQGFQLKVLNEQYGPLPEWIFEAAQARGVTEIWDNRSQLASKPKMPWFRSSKKFTDSKGDQIPFWPR